MLNGASVTGGVKHAVFTRIPHSSDLGAQDDVLTQHVWALQLHEAGSRQYWESGKNRARERGVLTGRGSTAPRRVHPRERVVDGGGRLLVRKEIDAWAPASFGTPSQNRVPGSHPRSQPSHPL